ncbi:hypothetical protein DOTSEDRAFT_70414 [Dothistroma septosporum NZE10]|uniref:Uncharacterized protein n=1 Tax=Dothistroma septosporum (strain NZE10 / CBS 128990) TaxID=675120 RepID=N1PTX8_DOTSN|nr:hypothetical protein DOTSEDRAFT_70414 [Dothistroma septosporum NZE10]
MCLTHRRIPVRDIYAPPAPAAFPEEHLCHKQVLHEDLQYVCLDACDGNEADRVLPKAAGGPVDSNATANIQSRRNPGSRRSVLVVVSVFERIAREASERMPSHYLI